MCKQLCYIYVTWSEILICYTNICKHFRHLSCRPSRVTHRTRTASSLTFDLLWVENRPSLAVGKAPVNAIVSGTQVTGTSIDEL